MSSLNVTATEVAVAQLELVLEVVVVEVEVAFDVVLATFVFAVPEVFVNSWFRSLNLPALTCDRAANPTTSELSFWVKDPGHAT